MAIASLADLRAARRQIVLANKIATGGSIFGPSIGEFPFWDIAGNPGAGSYSSNTSSGVVPDASTTGAFPLLPFSGNGYLTAVEAWTDGLGTNYGRLFLYDRLFTCGSFTTNSNVTLSSQPSYSARVPGGTDFTGLLLCAEQASASGNTQNATITVTYTDQDGNTGHSTPARVPQGAGSASNVGKQRFILPFQAGDTGVQKVESVVMTNMSSKFWNVVVLRPIWSGSLSLSTRPVVHTFLQTGLPEIFTNSCLELAIKSPAPNSSSPSEWLSLEIASL